jgi:hypothetical protein
LKIQTDPQEWYSLTSRQRSPGIPDDEAGDEAVEAPFIIQKTDIFIFYFFCLTFKIFFCIIKSVQLNLN